MNQPDDPLLDRASKGDSLAFDELIADHLPGLEAYVRLRAGRRLLAKESSADIVQSVCREAFRDLGRFQYDGELGFKRWLYRAAQRKIQNRHRFYGAARRDLAREVDVDAGVDGVLDCYRSFCTPSAHLMGAEATREIEQAFAQLPEDQREALLQSRVVGLTHTEIATAMERTEGSVRMLISRALAALAAALDRADIN